MGYMAMNLSANMLGLGNAATPMGLEAAKRLGSGPRAGNALCLFLVINCSSVQILPTGVIALRAAAGAAQPGDIWLPTLVCSLVATAVGIVCCKLMERKG